MCYDLNIETNNINILRKGSDIMKKNLFVIMVVLAGALSINPLSIALENTEKENNLPDVMYVSNQDAEVNDSVNEGSNNQDKINADSNIADKSIVKSNIGESGTSNNNINKQNVIKEKKYSVDNSYENKDISSRNQNKESISYTVKKNNFNDKSQYTYNMTAIVNQDAKIDNTEDKSINKEEALKILKSKNSKLKYDYMGDENTFDVLKEKGQEGYVFVPDVQTDLGLFVNKNTKEVYIFHSSGSLDIY